MGTCNWPVEESCLPDPGEDPAKIAKLGAAVGLAQEVLWALSGRQFGACSVIARPCKGGGGCPSPGEVVSWGSNQVPWFPMWTGGRWQNVTCCGQNHCGANGPGVVHLPGPVEKVLEVSIDGAALDPSAYSVEGDYLFRRDASAWPSQNLGRALGETGTWAVTYLRGYPVPAGVGTFVAKLATEFYNACTGGKCKLPRRVTSISRQGVSYEMADPTDIYASGKTGLPDIDLWLASVNPNALTAAPRVR
ncbi:head-tail adaptor [Rhodococcus phage ReqiPine5]|uniref:Gp22 n=1 Tax=Rhodococcus phage ReqiPine5 TaxID=691963 RepID=D4P7Z7_9CAUD|nr:head-tail adaptor [Rhodococcus phage ReqiPine5]ADD81127.1 gp22 [Rhodococcus phage ReqiPine5]